MTEAAADSRRRALDRAPGSTARPPSLARDLLGSRSSTTTPEGTIGGRIVEVEAYRGPGGPGRPLVARPDASQRGDVRRRPGTCTSTSIYGLHHCLNVVAGPGHEARGGAASARWRSTRASSWRARRRGDGAGRAAGGGAGQPGRALGVDRTLNGTDLLAGPVRLEPRAGPPPRDRAAARGSASTTPAHGRRARCASRSPMTRTAPALSRAAGAAADAGTLRALEFAAIVEQLAALTAFEPSRELALATLSDGRCDARRRCSRTRPTRRTGCWPTRRRPASAARATFGHALERASRGGRLTAGGAARRGRDARATDRFAARLPGLDAARTWRSVRDELDPAPELRGADRAQRRRERRGPRHARRPSWPPSGSGCAPPRTGSASG